MNNFLNISDHSSSELRAIIDEAKARKFKRKELNKSTPDEDKLSKQLIGLANRNWV